MKSVNWVEVLDLTNWSGALEKLLQKFETSPSESSESSTFQQFQWAQQDVIFLMPHSHIQPWQQTVIKHIFLPLDSIHVNIFNSFHTLLSLTLHPQTFTWPGEMAKVSEENGWVFYISLEGKGQVEVSSGVGDLKWMSKISKHIFKRS